MARFNGMALECIWQVNCNWQTLVKGESHFHQNLYILYVYTYQKSKEVPAPDPVPSLDRLTSASPGEVGGQM